MLFYSESVTDDKAKPRFVSLQRSWNRNLFASEKSNDYFLEKLLPTNYFSITIVHNLRKYETHFSNIAKLSMSIKNQTYCQ